MDLQELQDIFPNNTEELVMYIQNMRSSIINAIKENNDKF